MHATFYIRRLGSKNKITKCIFASLFIYAQIFFAASPQEQLFELCSQEGDNIHAVEDLLSTHSIGINSRLFLYAAVQNKNEKIANLLLTKKANVNALGIDSVTSLYAALESSAGTNSMVKLLLKHNANPNFKALHLECATPLHKAAQADAVQAVDMLIKYSANLEVTNKKGFSPLTYTCYYDQKGFTLDINELSPQERQQRITIISLLRYAGADCFPEIDKDDNFIVMPNKHSSVPILLPKPIAKILHEIDDKRLAFLHHILGPQDYSQQLPSFPKPLAALIISYIMRATLSEKLSTQKKKPSCCEIM